MIRVKGLTPSVYTERSRDYQTVLSPAFDIVLNSIKTNVDALENLTVSNTYDKKLLDLLCYTLGFKKAHIYNVVQLNALCSVFMTVIKNKGNVKSISTILSTLANVENVKEACIVKTSDEDPYCLDIFVPSSVQNTELFEDILDYILPAGMTYHLYKQYWLTPSEMLKVYYGDKIDLNMHKSAYLGVLRYYSSITKEDQLNLTLDGTSSNNYKEINNSYTEIVGGLGKEVANFKDVSGS